MITLQAVNTALLVVLLIYPTNTWSVSLNTDTSLLQAQGSAGRGQGVADTTGGSARGYRIMKYTLHSRRASPHLSWGSQISQVTEPPPTWCTVIHTSTTQPSSTRSLQLCAVYTLLVCQSWSDSGPNLSCHPAPLALHRRTAERDKRPVLVPHRGKKEKYSGNESCNTILCVPSVSLSRDKRAREKLWAYFSLHVMWKTGRGK